MFRRNTVFVVGAGASNELGLPIGAELSAQISEQCNIELDTWGNPASYHSEYMLGQLRHRTNGDRSQINAFLLAMREIQQALPFKDSIDAVIDQYYDRPEIAEIGKFFIASLILKAEASSKLQSTGNTAQPDLRAADKTWLHEFVRMLFDGLRADKLYEIGDNITIICFNYDRCIERYLAHAIAANYGLELQDAVQVAGRVRIIHAYGSLGALPEWVMPGHGSITPFGATNHDVWQVSKNLKTFSESIDSDTDETLKSIIRDADQYVYLGLGFGRQNMDLLSTDAFTDGIPSEREVYASGFKLPEQSRAAICSLLQQTYSKSARVSTFGRSPFERTHLELAAKAADLLHIHRYNILA